MTSSVDGHRLQYVLDRPTGAPRPAAGWPLLLFLHGAGERGDDLARVSTHGPPKLVDEIPALGACVLVSPLCPSDSWWKPDALMALLDEVVGGHAVDASRIYVTGLSMGGYGTWSLVSRYPDRFAAAVPICGGGDPSRLWSQLPNAFDPDGLLRARAVPIRAFHGENDAVVPPEESRRLVAQLEQVKGNALLVVYPDLGHDAWTTTYADPELYRWLFSNRLR